MTQEMKTIIGLLAASISLMVLGPFTIHEHYVFGIMALVLVALIYCPQIAQGIVGICLVLLWLPAILTGGYVGTARVATADRLACIQSLCTDYSQPIYVVTNGSSHDHQGLGYAYLAQKNECNMFAVTQWKDQLPQTMVVMNENANFDQTGTDFYELNRFGIRNWVGELNCGQNLTATIFSRN